MALLAGYSWQEFSTDVTNVVATGFDNDNLGYNLSSQNQNAFALRERNRLVSFFGRANYNFDGRYLLTATLRGDGSNRFGNGNRWAGLLSANF